MYSVIVTFEIHQNALASFHTAMQKQAENSLALEKGCHTFDVIHSDTQSNLVILSEIYTDRAAFDLHLQSEHFNSFDRQVSDWIIKKSVFTGTVQGNLS